MIAHAPILSIVSRSSAQRSFWAMVPFDMIAAEVRPMQTPIAVTMPGQTRHSSMIGIRLTAAAVAAGATPSAARRPRRGRPRAFSRSICLLEAVARHGVHAERGEHLAQDVVRRQVAVLELLHVRADLLVDEPLHRVADHLVLVAPLEHRMPRFLRPTGRLLQRW